MIARLKQLFHWRRLAIIPPVVLGVLILVVLVKTRKQPGMVQYAERVTSVRVIEARAMPVVPRAVGYGYVQPSQTWDAVAEMPGKVVQLHPEFKRGAMLAKGEVLVRIDPAESGFVREQSEAEVRRVQALIRQLDQSEKDTRRQLEVEQGRLDLSRKNLERNRQLVRQGVISQSELDTVEQAYLAQRNAVQNYQSSLNAMPSERASFQAQLASARSRSADARQDEGKTVIRTPFNCRLSSVRVEVGQAVTMNQVVATLDSLGSNEVLVQVPFHAFRNLLPEGAAATLGVGVDMEEFRRFLGIDVVIRMRSPERDVEWLGHLSRISDSVDSSTRTVGVYVVVDHELREGNAPERQPLIKNMYAEVELLGRRTGPFVVIPRAAIDSGMVNVMGADGRLVRRSVSVAFIQSSLAAIRSGIEPGEKVVVSDIVPAIEGMLLGGEKDIRLEQRLADEAMARVAMR